jgi:hypothetical protein
MHPYDEENYVEVCSSNSMLKKSEKIKKKQLKLKKYANIIENMEISSISLLKTCTRNLFGVQSKEKIFCERTYILSPFSIL